MMTYALIATLCLAPCQDADKPTEMVGRMLAKYSKATTLTGEITWTQQVKESSIVTKTTLQFDLPSKLYIRQERGGASSKGMFVVSDGTTFSYPVPPDLPSKLGERLSESVMLGGKSQTVRDIYSVISKSLIDRSLPLDVSIGRLEDLKFLRSQWVTMEVSGTATIDNNEITIIKGQWRPYGQAPPSGTYEMWLTKGDELRRYVQREKLEIDRVGLVEVVGIWDCKLVVDGKPDPDLFVIKK